MQRIKEMLDVKDWMGEDVELQLSGHVDQHQFKIERSQTGNAVVQYKKWSTSGQWKPEEGTINCLCYGLLDISDGTQP